MTTLKYFITSKAKRNLLKFFLTDINASYYTREAARLTGEPLNAVRRELGYLEKAGLLRSYMQGNLKYYSVIKSFPLLEEWRKIILETTDVHIVVDESPEAPLPAEAVAPPGAAIAPPTFVIEDEETQPSEPQSIIIPLDHPVSPPATVIASDIVSELSPEPEEKQLPPHFEPKLRSILTLDSVIHHLRDKFYNVNAISLAILHGEAARSEKIPEDGIELLVVGDIKKDILLELIADLEVATGIDISLTHMTSSDFDYRNAQGDPLVRRIWGEKKLVVKGRH